MGKHKILVVDDDPLNVKLLSAMLPSDTYDKMSANSGTEALSILEKHQPDLILLDVMMPGMDGCEVCEKIKGDEKCRDIPIVLVTAMDGIDIKIKGLECGADEFINKPVNVQELRARVASLVKLKDYQDELKTGIGNGTVMGFGEPQTPRKWVSLDLPTVLIVEDNEKDAKLIHSYLYGEPYLIKVVSTGEEAITCATYENIDVIILDLLLSGMDGFKVCKLLKETDITKNIQIVVITSLMDLESKIKGINLGADDYLVKPVNPYELRVRTKALIKKKAYLDSLCSSYDLFLNKLIRDRQTGLLSHDFFHYCFNHEIKRCLRHNASLCLLMLKVSCDPKNKGDMDSNNQNLKYKKAIADVIKNNIRDIDLASYDGTNKVMVLMMHSKTHEATIVGDRLKQTIEENMELREMTAQDLVVSYAVGEYPNDAETKEALVHLTETKLK